MEVDEIHPPRCPRCRFVPEEGTTECPECGYVSPEPAVHVGLIDEATATVTLTFEDDEKAIAAVEALRNIRDGLPSLAQWQLRDVMHGVKIDGARRIR